MMDNYFFAVTALLYLIVTGLLMMPVLIRYQNGNYEKHSLFGPFEPDDVVIGVILLVLLGVILFSYAYS